MAAVKEHFKLKSDVNTVLPDFFVNINLHFSRDISYTIEEKFGNGFKKALLTSLDELLEVAGQEKADLVYKASKESRDFVSRCDKSLLKTNFGKIVGVSLNPVAAVLGHTQLPEMDNKAKTIIDVIDVPSAEDVRIEVDMPSISGVGHPDIIESYNKFLNRFRKPLTEARIRRRIVKAYSHQPQMVEINRILLLTLKSLLDNRLDKSVYDVFVGDEVFEWRDLEKVPDKGDFKNIGSRWICVEYSPQRKVDIIRWINQTVDFAIMNRLMSPYIVVLAKYGEFKDYEVPALIGEFNRAGASFMNFPKGSRGFKNALERLEKELTEDEDIAAYEEYAEVAL
jgi:hypothetical protein